LTLNINKTINQPVTKSSRLIVLSIKAEMPLYLVLSISEYYKKTYFKMHNLKFKSQICSVV